MRTGAFPAEGDPSPPSSSFRPWILALGFVPGAFVWAGCTFEPRAVGGELPPVVESAVGAEVVVDVEETIRREALRTTELFRSAVAAGDLSRALALVDREATLVDGLVGDASEPATRGELLLELRRRHADGVELELIEADVDVLSEEYALVSSRLALLEVGDNGLGEERGRVHETIFLALGPDGWRILRLHRSLAPPGAGPLLRDETPGPL